MDGWSVVDHFAFYLFESFSQSFFGDAVIFIGGPSECHESADVGGDGGNVVEGMFEVGTPVLGSGEELFSLEEGDAVLVDEDPSGL